jgi:hypothetical protein
MRSRRIPHSLRSPEYLFLAEKYSLSFSIIFPYDRESSPESAIPINIRGI